MTFQVCHLGRVPTRRPDAVRVGFDYGAWCVEFRRFGALVVRRPAASEDDARAEVARLGLAGLRVLPDAPPSLPVGGAA